MKNSPRPLFLLHKTLQLTLCIGTGSVLLASDKPRFITPENAFPVLQSPMAASFTPLQPTLGIANGDLVCGCSGHGNPFHEAPD
jgi:hypothetical protein